MIPSTMNHHILALPPSTCCPSSFKDMYYRSYYASSHSMHQQNNYRHTDDLLPLVPSPIPPEIIPNILSYCDATTLSRASCVCRSWSILANANVLWTVLCKEVFAVTPQEQCHRERVLILSEEMMMVGSSLSIGKEMKSKSVCTYNY